MLPLETSYIELKCMDHYSWHVGTLASAVLPSDT